MEKTRSQILETFLLHQRYLQRVEAYVNGHAPTADLCAPAECPLGRWYYRDAIQNPLLHNYPGFRRLGELHRRFHQYTEMAVRLHDAGNLSRAYDLLREAVGLSGEIGSLLLEMDAFIESQPAGV